MNHNFLQPVIADHIVKIRCRPIDVDSKACAIDPGDPHKGIHVGDRPVIFMQSIDNGCILPVLPAQRKRTDRHVEGTRIVP